MAYTPSQLCVLANIRSPLKAKAMPAEVTNIDVNVSGSGHEQAVVTLAPVEKGVKQDSLTLRLYVSKVDDSIAANPQALGRVKQKAYGFFRAMDPAFPQYPKKVGNGAYQSADGATLTYTEYNALSNQVTEAIFARLESMTKETMKPFIGKKVFMLPQEAKLDESKRVSQFVSWIAGELQDGADFITEDLVDDDKLKEIIAQATAE